MLSPSFSHFPRMRRIPMMQYTPVILALLALFALSCGDTAGSQPVGNESEVPRSTTTSDDVTGAPQQRSSDAEPSTGSGAPPSDEETNGSDASRSDQPSEIPSSHGEPCPEGETRCAGSELQRCVSGVWTTLRTCSSGCAEQEQGWACACVGDADCGPDEGCAQGACATRICTAGELACSDGSITRCNVDGLGWAVLRACSAGCRAMEDEVFCTCESGAEDEGCDEGENCAPYEGAEVCLGDACTPETSSCDGPFRVQCSTAGRESARTDCSPLACDSGECRCLSDDMCGQGEFCSASGECRSRLCEPDVLECVGDAIRQCDARGASATVERFCPVGTCSEGSCACTGPGDCYEGERCDDGSCSCTSGLFCGSERQCCPEGWLCDSAERCDGSGVCEVVERCIPDCGSFDRCGEDGESCCTEALPICGAENRCAPDCGEERRSCSGRCCDAGEVCILDACTAPGAPCNRFSDCDFGEYCEHAIERCLPLANPEGIDCREEGDFRELAVQVKWENRDDEIISTPVVGDVTGDGVPNVVYNASRIGNADWVVGEIVVLDGRDGTPLGRVPHEPTSNRFGSQGRSNIALGDVSGDGVLDIIYASRQVTGNRSWVVAVNGQGETLWRARDRSGNLVATSVVNGGVTVARFGNDHRAWSVVGGMLVDPDGRVVFNPDGNGGALGTNSGYVGGVAVVADLTMDGFPDISIGNRAFSVRVAEEPLDDGWPDVTVNELWEANVAGGDGYTAVADMTGDGRPEVVLVGGGNVHVLDGATGTVVAGPIRLPGPTTNNRGGPPTIADFDGDGRPEIGVAGGHFYTVFDLARPDEEIVQPDGDPPPSPGELFVRWRNPSRDLSSNATGSSVFDFQGDGAAEVIYADECYMRVYDGRDGTTQLEIMNSTGTILEYPIVVDVDGNGRSEIVIVANRRNAANDCAGIPDYVPRQGIFVYEDPNDAWVRTRSIWNQHAYSINNIGDDGSLPDTTEPSWLEHNTFRANRQGEIPLNAPDPRLVSFTVGIGSCPLLRLNLVIENAGLRSIEAGMPIRIETLDGEGGVLGIAVDTTLDRPLLPGESTGLVFEWLAPAFEPVSLRAKIHDLDGQPPHGFDCNPGDTQAEVRSVSCY